MLKRYNASTNERKKQRLIRDRIAFTYGEDWGEYSLEFRTLKTDLSDGIYDAVVLHDVAPSLDGRVTHIYRKAKAYLGVRDHELVPHTVDNMCEELVALDPQHRFLLGLELINRKRRSQATALASWVSRYAHGKRSSIWLINPKTIRLVLGS
jgi:hypothetical protein